MKHPYNLQLDALKSAYANHAFSPRELIQALRERALQLNPEYKLFIHILTEEELAPYLANLEATGPESLPLYGVPFAVKDNIDLAGVPTTAACPAFSYIPAKNATIVAQLIALGAIPIGKTNLDQFATGLNGTRSPYGLCRNSVLAEYPSGGSSAGSALAVALGLASFALGTDTAGSGRVPAALNNLIGLKATKGLISTAGVVPACRTLDCTTFFTATALEASKLLALTAHKDPEDEYSRANVGWNTGRSFGIPTTGFKFGVPKQLEFLGCAESQALFERSVSTLETMGGIAIEIDFSAFLEAAKLLYEGPWVAERYSVVGELIENNPEAVLPVIRDVLQKAPTATAVQAFRAQYKLQALKVKTDAILANLDFMITPAYPRPVTLAELAAEPVKRNSDLGTYTNFMNLLDYAAVAVPAGFMRNGLPSGVTLFGRAFCDQYLLSIADSFQRTSKLPLIGQFEHMAAPPTTLAKNDRSQLLVCGAHLDGLPLNWQLKDKGGQLLKKTQTSSAYQFYALAGSPPKRPGLRRVATGGRSFEVEIWEIPTQELGAFLNDIPAPLGLGKVELIDGSWVTGFICEDYALETADEISQFSGWRDYLQHQ